MSLHYSNFVDHEEEEEEEEYLSVSNFAINFNEQYTFIKNLNERYRFIKEIAQESNLHDVPLYDEDFLNLPFIEYPTIQFIKKKGKHNKIYHDELIEDDSLGLYNFNFPKCVKERCIVRHSQNGYFSVFMWINGIKVSGRLIVYKGMANRFDIIEDRHKVKSAYYKNDENIYFVPELVDKADAIKKISFYYDQIIEEENFSCPYGCRTREQEIEVASHYWKIDGPKLQLYLQRNRKKLYKPNVIRTVEILKEKVSEGDIEGVQNLLLPLLNIDYGNDPIEQILLKLNECGNIERTNLLPGSKLIKEAKMRFKTQAEEHKNRIINIEEC